MAATSIYRAAPDWPRRVRLSGLGAGLLLTLLATPLPAAYTNRVAEAASQTPLGERERLARTYAEAKARFGAAPTNTEAAWHLARACFDGADLAANDAQRVALAREGIAVCRQLMARAPRLAAGHYYLGLNLGELARTETLRALKLVKEMEAEFKTAIELDPQFDYGGPDRSLGLLYQDAPGWPVSLGSRRRAREHLAQAVQQAPGFPENRLCLLEALLEAGNRQAARVELAATETTLPAARAQFSGEQWAAPWKDWETRLAAAKARLGDNGEPTRSPRDR